MTIKSYLSGGKMKDSTKKELKNVARVIIRKAICTHGRAKVRELLKSYRAQSAEYDQIIRAAFADFAGEVNQCQK